MWLFVHRSLIVCGALWCAAAITAAVTPPDENNAPTVAAASPHPVPIEVVVEPLQKADRMPVPIPVPAIAVAPVDIKVNVEPKVPHRASDRVCGERGRRWFWRHHHHSWRCRR